MAEVGLYPAYIARDEEREIIAAAERVRKTRQSRVVLLYGAGGVGKTRLARALAERQAMVGQATWLEPIDVDDPEYWLLANLQGNIARQLDPANDYFGQYLTYIALLPAHSGEHVTAETVVSRLGHIRRIFLECYAAYVKATAKPVVIIFDTVETIRGTEFLVTLTQWMKSLPDTLFILSGRPMPTGSRSGVKDPIENELTGLHRPMPVTTVPLAEFSRAAAERYLSESSVAAGLTDEEKTKLILLTRGHPLWLALTVSYLDAKGIPEEVSTPLAIIERDIPYRGQLLVSGQHLQEDFKRRLMSPYRDTDFWHEAVKRLAAVRQGVSEPILQQLMADRPFPKGVVGATEAWHQLLTTPWIRPRSNHRFITLHDAMAEELAKRVIPVHDEDRQWRQGLWRRAVEIYEAQAQDQEQRFTIEVQKLDSRRQLAGKSGRLLGSDGALTSEHGPLISEATRLDAGKREIDLLKLSGLDYQILSDFAVGCQRFLDLFEQARRDQDLLFQDLLATSMQRYLPASDTPNVFGDVVKDVVNEFRDWLTAGQHALYREIGAAIAEYQVSAGQGTAAVELLKSLPLGNADAYQLIRHNRLLGNAYLRVPGQVKEGLRYFQEALSVAEGADLEQVERNRLIAGAHKSLGFYYRSVGRWHDADAAYERARNAISLTLTQRKSDEDRSEMASIQSNWAYVKGLSGYDRDGLSMVQSAIEVREKLGLRLEVGMSQSTRGEVHRYQERWKKAWEAYALAEEIFDTLQDPYWLGTIYQEQAICLFQAYRDGTSLIEGVRPLDQARELALKAVEICRERAVRVYPSALNRAGRIVGYQDADEGLRYLAEGIDAAREMSDGWFLLANMVEYAELSYRAWAKTGRAEHRAGIERYESDQANAMSEYEFPHLRGRWEILRAHLYIHDWVTTGDDAMLDLALREYTDGFGHIAERGYVGSSGTSVIPGTFETFRDLLHKLPSEVQVQWLEHLRLAWTGSQPGSTMLLAQLERLY